MKRFGSCDVVCMCTLVCALTLALASPGCQTRPPPDKQADKAGETAAPAQPQAPPTTAIPPTGTPSRPAAARPTPPKPAAGGATERPTVPLPPALEVASVGTFTPAPWLDGVERALGFRLRDKPYIAAAGTGWLRVYTPAGKVVAEAQERGAAQVMYLLPSYDDKPPGGEAAVRFALGRGISRDDRAAPMSVTLYRFDGRSLVGAAVELPQTSRTQVVAIAQRKPAGTLWMLAFESKYHALLLSAERSSDGRYVVTREDSIRVPLGMVLGDPDGDGQNDIFIARPYGETPDEPGDVFRWRKGAARELLPTTRGARALTVVDGAPDGMVVVADGWHKNYGQMAKALVTRIDAAPGSQGKNWRPTTLAHVAGRHGFDRLYTGHFDGDDRLDLIAAGNGPAILIAGLAPVTESVPALGSAEARDVAIVPPSSGAKGRRSDVVIVGPKPGIWRLDD